MTLQRKWIASLFSLALSLVSASAHAGGEYVTYLHSDIQGSPTMATDEQGKVVWQEEYEPWGARQIKDNASATPSRGSEVWYTGKEEEGSLGLYYYGARWYSPEIGQFYSMDPAEVEVKNPRSFSRYAYASNNPIMYVDPNGRWSAKAHDKIIASSLMGRIPSADVAAIQQASRDFDKRTQDASQSYMHSMAQDGQSPAVARKLRDDFIAATLKDAKKAADHGDRSDALRLFGEAMHPVMDSSSPEHTDKNGNPKIWRGVRDAWGHSPTDWVGNETSKDLTPAILKSQSAVINKAYDQVFGARKSGEQ